MRRDGQLKPASWARLSAPSWNLRGKSIGAIAGDTMDAESLFALKGMLAAMGSNLDARQDGAKLDASRPDYYLFNSSIAGIEEADAIVILGSNPRVESPVLNARIRKRWTAGGMRVGLVGQAVDLTYPATSGP